MGKIFSGVPHQREHLARAQDNEDLARTFNLDDGLEVDWAITLLFYAAIHYVQAFFAARGIVHLDHDARDQAIEQHPILSDISRDYQYLKNKSRSARYDIPNYTREQFEQASARFERIKAFISKQFKT